MENSSLVLSLALLAGISMGHLVGDFPLQPKILADGKSKPGKRGMIICTIHCLVYTASICLFLYLFTLETRFVLNLWTAPIVFLSHWPIDRWHLGGRWMWLFKDRMPGEPFFEVRYKEIDNLFHILIMFFALRAVLIS